MYAIINLLGPDVLEDAFDMNDENENMASHWHDSEILKRKKKDTLIERIKESPLNHGYDGKKHYPSYPLLKPGAPYLVKIEDPAVEELKRELKEEKKKKQGAGGKIHKDGDNEMKTQKEMDGVERKAKKVVTIIEPSAKQPPGVTVKAKDQTLPHQIKNTDLNAAFNKKEWSGAIKKVAERLFVDPTMPEIEPKLSHRPDINRGKKTVDTSMVDQLSYAERLQVMIMQVREDTALAEREIREVELRVQEKEAKLPVLAEDSAREDSQEKEIITATDDKGEHEILSKNVTHEAVDSSVPKQEEVTSVDQRKDSNNEEVGVEEGVSVYSQDPDQL